MFTRTWLLVVMTVLLIGAAACGGDDSASSPGFSGDLDAPSEEPDSARDYDEAAEAAPDEERLSAAQIGASGIDRRVIRNGELELTVEDVPAAVRHARDLAPDFDGYVESSSTRTLTDGEEQAELALEVRSADFDRVLDELRNGPHVVRVDHESTSSRDVTEEFVDLSSQLENLESTEHRFVELLAEAHSIDEILRVETEISRTRGEIERIQGRLNYLEQRTDYSRIYVTFQLDSEDGLIVGGQNFTPGQTAQEAWNASMQFVGTIGNAIIAVAVFFWWGWPLVAIAVAFGMRYQRRKRTAVPA